MSEQRPYRVYGARLRSWRDARCETRGQAASGIGCSLQQLLSWEHGLRLPTVPNAVAIADWYGISPVELIPLPGEA